MVSHSVLIFVLLCAGAAVGDYYDSEELQAVNPKDELHIIESDENQQRCNDCLSTVFDIIKKAQEAKKEGKDLFIKPDLCTYFTHFDICISVVGAIMDADQLNILHTRLYCEGANYCPSKYDTPENNSTDRRNSTIKPGYRPTIKPGYRPTVKPGYRPTVKPGYRPTVKPGYRPTVKPGHHSTVKPGHHIPSTIRPGSDPVTFIPGLITTTPVNSETTTPKQDTDSDDDENNDHNNYSGCKSCLEVVQAILVADLDQNGYLSPKYVCKKFTGFPKPYCYGLVIYEGKRIQRLLSKNKKSHEICNILKQCRRPKELPFCRACKTFAKNLTAGIYFTARISCSYLPAYKKRRCVDSLISKRGYLRDSLMHMPPLAACRRVGLCYSPEHILCESQNS